MKKILLLLLAVVLMASMFSCDGNSNVDKIDEPTLTTEEIKAQEDDEKVKNVIDLIDAASSVYNSDYTTKEKIQKAEDAYEKLEEQLKQRVTNYDKLARAWKHYDFYYTCWSAKFSAEFDLKSRLKNPDSLQINSSKVEICYDATLTKQLAVHVMLDYSAQNGFGGYNRDTMDYTVEIRENGALDSKEIGLLDFYNIKDENNGKIITYAGALD